jgi:hypothetical protein
MRVIVGANRRRDDATLSRSHQEAQEDSKLWA